MDVQPLKLRATGNGQIINRWYLTRPLVTTSDIAQDTHYPWLVLIRRLAIPISVDISVNNLSIWSNSFSLMVASWRLWCGMCGSILQLFRQHVFLPFDKDRDALQKGTWNSNVVFYLGLTFWSSRPVVGWPSVMQSWNWGRDISCQKSWFYNTLEGNYTVNWNITIFFF